MANLQIATEARRAVTKKPVGYPSKKGKCQMLARLVAKNVFLSNRFFEEADGSNVPDAVQAAKHLLELKLAHHYNGDPHSLEEGYYLYKTEGSGGFGHVGILYDKSDPDWREWLVAENSTYHARRDAKKRGVPLEKGDARGTRTLVQFGAFQVVGRLPTPVRPASVLAKVVAKVAPPKPVAPTLVPQLALFMDGRPIKLPIHVKDNRVFAQLEGVLVPVRALSDALGFEVSLDRANSRVNMRSPQGAKS